jgi:hypothetical protein
VDFGKALVCVVLDCCLFYFIVFRAAMHAFQKPPDSEKGISEDEPQLRHSNIITYTGIDKREGLVTIAKRLLRSGYHYLLHLTLISNTNTH